MKKVKKYKLECAIEHDYFLIGIHSVLEDYRLAYFLNDAFNICLKRTIKDITFQNKEGSFSNFDYEDETSFSYWSLINNRQFVEKEVKKDSFSLFNEISNTYILIPEKKTTDYFLKIEGDFNNNKIKELANRINIIHNVMTTYELNPETLRSKDFLIF